MDYTKNSGFPCSNQGYLKSATSNSGWTARRFCIKGVRLDKDKFCEDAAIHTEISQLFHTSVIK
jgi:hypothetical protein